MEDIEWRSVLPDSKTSAPEAESKGTLPIPLDILIVDEDSAKELLCGICLQILSRPRQCRNGHLFCYSCIAQHVVRHPECPQCRSSLKENELARSLFVERHLQQLRVYCKYHFCKAPLEEESTAPSPLYADNWVVDKEGCNEVHTYENVSKHEKECGYAFVSCKYSTKCDKLRKKDVEQHEKSCAYKPLECSFCHNPVEVNKMDQHLKEKCTMLPINCDKCNMSVQRSEMEAHHKLVCPEAKIPCLFAEQGCQVKIVRKHLKEHLTAECGSHLAMLKKSFDEQYLMLKQTYETQLKIKDDKIKSLEKTLSEIDTKIDWKVNHWSNVKRKSYIQSDKFHFAEFNWFIGFYTDGDNEESRGFISVYLFLDVGSVPKGKSVTIEFQLKFVNHKDPNESVRKEFKTNFPIKGGQGWGDRKAIRASSITEEAGFLKQDALYVEAQISLKKVHWSLH